MTIRGLHPDEGLKNQKDETICSFPRKLADGLWVLGNYYFNLYLVKGEQAAALIEAGVSGVVDEVIRQLESLGIRPTFLVVTHPHADHCTGLDGLRERYRDALVVAGERAEEFLSHPKAAEALVTEDRHMSNRLKAFGLEPGRPPVTEPPSLSDCLIARDGDEMDLGGVTLKYLEVEGHSPGNIAVHIPELETLIASDSMGFRFSKRGFYPLFFTGFCDHLETLARLRALKPKIVGIAHQGPRMGRQVEEDFEQAINVTLELQKKIVEDPRDPEEIAKDLFDDSYDEEFLLYTPENILNCCRLLVKRASDQ